MDTLQYRLGLDGDTVVEDYRHIPMEERLGFREEDRLFVDAILSRGEAPVTALDGFRSVQLACACYRSAEEKGRIHI